MAYIDEVSEVVGRMADGITDAIREVLSANAPLIADLVREQLMSGQFPDGSRLTPSYMKDPYFTELAIKQGAKDVTKTARKLAGGYVAYKMRITPPSRGKYLGLSPRDRIQPNLFISGYFHRSISVSVSGKEIATNATAAFTEPIKAKYGPNVIDIGKSAQTYIVDNVLTKGIEDYYVKCGW